MARTTDGLYWIGTLDGCPPAKREYSLKGGTAYYDGEVLRLSPTSGSACRARTAGTSILGVCAANVKSADATTTNVLVYLADGNNIFEGKRLVSTTPKQVLHDLCDLATIGSNHNYRLAATASTKVLRIVGFDPDKAPLTAATGVKFWVVFQTATTLTAGDAVNTY